MGAGVSASDRTGQVWEDPRGWGEGGVSNVHGIHLGQVWDDAATTLLVVRALPYDDFECLVLSVHVEHGSAPISVYPGAVIKLSGFLVKHDATLIAGPDPDGPLPNS